MIDATEALLLNDHLVLPGKLMILLLTLHYVRLMELHLSVLAQNLRVNGKVLHRLTFVT